MRLNSQIIIHLMGLLLLCNGCFMLFAAVVSGIYGDGVTLHISLASIITMLPEAIKKRLRPRKDI